MKEITVQSDLEAIRQEHESWLGELEGLAVEAIASNNWDAFYVHLIDFQNENDLHGETGIAISKNLTVRFLKVSTKDLSRPGADSSSRDRNKRTQGTKPIMSQQPELTPKQQALMNFLDQLATTPLTTETLARGNPLTTANILAAYEHTIFAITEGEHLENNASDPILALFVAKLRQHTNQLPSWVMEAFRHLEQAENQRRAHLDAAYGYMFGNLDNQAPVPQSQVGQNTRLGAVDVPAQPVDAEGEQRLGKPQVLPAIDVPAQSTPLRDSTSDQAGQEILDAIVKTRRSTLLIGDTGAGKSVTQAYILTKLFELHPNAEVFVLAQKADSFCGLAEAGRVTLFDPTEPEEALFLIHSIWILYDHRRRLPESKRPALSPVRLILADWLSINQALEDLNREEPVKSSKYLSKLADIIYNGRELNVCLLVDLQSYNLAAVGLKADRNSRKNFNLLGLGNYSIDDLGMVNESYGVLINLIGDRYIVADESERTALNATFKKLQPISKANQRPIIFSGLSPAQLALLPDLRKFKNSKVSTVVKQPISVTEPADETQQ